jgi:hypothetical protein
MNGNVVLEERTDKIKQLVVVMDEKMYSNYNKTFKEKSDVFDLLRRKLGGRETDE